MDRSERRKASVHEDGVDRISNLPDPVLLLILAGLPSTKESIRTSILSRRWRSTWTSLPSLDFDYHGGRERSETSKFENVVNRALLHRSVDLESFRLSCSDYFSWSTLERWILLTVTRNVKHIDLTFWPTDDTVMPRCLVTCPSLEVLRLKLGGRLLVPTFPGFPVNRRLILPSFSGFPALRVLKLKYVELSDECLVNQLLKSCPLLEDLTLDNCKLDKIDVLCISCPNLKKLRFLCWSYADLCGCLKISCPKLVFLEIDGQAASNYIFEGVYSLEKAVINAYREVIAHAISQLFHIISHVEFLWTELYFLYQCVDAARDPALPNLKTLELYTRNDNETVDGLKQILKNSPKLESLVLTIRNDFSYEVEKEDYNETEYPNLDGVGTWNLTPDVAWIEFFELNGEKPKLTVKWYDNKPEWKNVVAKWGNKAISLIRYTEGNCESEGVITL